MIEESAGGEDDDPPKHRGWSRTPMDREGIMTARSTGVGRREWAPRCVFGFAVVAFAASRFAAVRLAILAAALALPSGCALDSRLGGLGGAPGGTGGRAPPPTTPEKLDVLFMMDNSPGTAIQSLFIEN